MATAPDYLPQFDAPFRLGPDGQPVTVVQDSPNEIGAAVYDIMVCPQGAAVNNPDFGIPSPLFDLLDIDTAAIVAAVQQLEPRATTDVVQRAITQVSHPQQVTLVVTSQVTTGS